MFGHDGFETVETPCELALFTGSQRLLAEVKSVRARRLAVGACEFSSPTTTPICVCTSAGS